MLGRASVRVSKRISDLKHGRLGSLPRQLTDVLDTEISKGIDLVDCLSGFGKHWRGGQLAAQKATVADVKNDIAKTIHFFDDFLSHDWLTSPYLKFIALCIEYNGGAATILGLFTAFIFGCLEIFVPALRMNSSAGGSHEVGGTLNEIDDVGHFGWVMGNITFCYFLFFWQRTRKLFNRRPYIVFMDKLCISQTNVKLKTKGILGLAGFLKISGRLVILWSPRYFTRLWCVYELASWMKLKKPLNDIEILPVAEASFMVSVYAGVFVWNAMVIWLSRYRRTVQLFYPMAASIGFLIYLLPLHIMRRNMRDLRLMPKQIEKFDFEQSKCFCCSVDHINSDTGEEIPCDRDLVRQQIIKWNSDPNPSTIAPVVSREAIAVFNKFVHGQFGKHILKRVGGAKVRYVSAVICCLPAWFNLADQFYLWWVTDGWAAMRLFMHFCTLTLAIFPSMLRFVLYVAHICDTYFGVRPNPFVDMLVTVCAGIVTMAPMLITYGALSTALKAKQWEPQFILTCACSILCLILYREDPIAWYRYIRSLKNANTDEHGSETSRSLDSLDLQDDVFEGVRSTGNSVTFTKSTGGESVVESVEQTSSAKSSTKVSL